MAQPPSSSSADQQMSFEAAMSAAMVHAVPDAPAPATEPTPEPAPEAAAPAPAVPEPVAPAPAEPKAPEPAATPEPAGLKQLMAREAAVLAKETEYRKYEGDLKTLTARLDEYEADKRAFLANPTKFIRNLAPDAKPSELAESIWFDDLGPAAPKEYHLQKEVREIKSTMQDQRKQEELRAKSEAEANARKEAETALNQYVGGLKEAIPQLDAGKNRLVKSLAAQNPDLAIRMMLDAAGYAAQENRMLTPAEAADAVEQYLAQFTPLYAAPPEAAPAVQAPPATDPQAKSVPSTLRNSSVSVQPSRAAADPTDPRVLRRNALIEAGLDPESPSLKAYLGE